MKNYDRDSVASGGRAIGDQLIARQWPGVNLLSISRVLRKLEEQREEKLRDGLE